MNVSPAALKWMRRALLSPDWFISTQRHFFANFGFGSLYDTRSFGEYVKESLRLKRAAAQQRPTGPSAAEAIEDDGDIYRKFRSKEARLCYVLGVCVFFYTMMNGLNAVMRARDEAKEKEKADEVRKTNPDYKSPYEPTRLDSRPTCSLDGTRTVRKCMSDGVSSSGNSRRCLSAERALTSLLL